MSEKTKFLSNTYNTLPQKKYESQHTNQADIRLKRMQEYLFSFCALLYIKYLCLLKPDIQVQVNRCIRASHDRPGFYTYAEIQIIFGTVRRLENYTAAKSRL